MRVHVLTTATKVLFFDEPRPDVPGSEYVGALDLSADEVAELRLMAEELGRDSEVGDVSCCAPAIGPSAE